MNYPTDQQIEDQLLHTGRGGTYVEAIDGCVKHDMPNNCFNVYELNGEWEAGFTCYFSCYDGWDSDYTQIGTFKTRTEALRACWDTYQEFD